MTGTAATRPAATRINVPAWVVGIWRDRYACETCGVPAVSVWAGTGELVCQAHLTCKQQEARV
jgi:hypothetical protein